MILLAVHLLKELQLIRELNLEIRIISKCVFVIKNVLRDFSCLGIESDFLVSLYIAQSPSRQGGVCALEIPNSELPLFHRHALGKVSRLVHVVSAQHGDVVGEQLERNAGENRHEHRAGLRDCDDVVSDFVKWVAIFRRDGDDLASASLDFADIADDLVEERILRGDDHDRHVFVDKGNRTVLHFCSGVAFGVDVADFLELQSAFHGDRVAEVATEVQEVVCLAERLGNFGDAVGELERFRHEIRKFQKVLHDVGACFKAESALAAEQEGNHGEHGHLACESLGAGHADFRTGVQVDATVACASDRRTDTVTDGECGCAFLLGFAESGERICSFAGLADGNDESSRLDNRVSVAEFRSVFDFDRDASQVFNHVFTDHACIVACAAGGDDDAVDVTEFLDVRVEASELCVAFGGEQTTAHGIAQYFGLFENFLEHEVRESALGDCIGVEFHVLDFALHFVAAHVHDGIAAILDLDNVVVIKVNDFLRVVDDGGNVTREVEIAIVSDTQNERTSTAGANQDVRFVAANNAKTESTFNLLESLEYGGFEVAIVIACNQVGYDFGIGLRLEFNTFGDELRLEACVVFDNAVVDNRNLSVIACMRVCVCFGGGAMGGPARVGNANRTLERGGL